MFMFQSQKTAHLLTIAGTGLAGSYAELMLQVPTASQVIAAIQVSAQVLIAVVTCIAAIRKAFQKPVVKAAATTTDVPAE